MLFLADFSENLPSYTHFIPLMIAFLTGVIGPILLVFVKHKLFRRDKELEKRKKDFKQSLETQELINTSLNNLQSKFNLDRLWIAQFHNGGNFWPGNKSMKKMSMTFESTAPGIAADIMRMQNLPVSFLSPVLQKLTETEVTGITIDVYTEEDYALRSFWESRGIQTVFLFPIKCLESDFIGIFGIDFVKRDGFITDEIYDQLRAEALILSGYIASISVDKGNK
jgi:hypothetical protein